MYLERLNKSVEQNSNTDTSSEQLDEPSGPEELEESDGDHLGGVDDTPDNRDEVERVPRVLEVILQQQNSVTRLNPNNSRKNRFSGQNFCLFIEATMFVKN